jgi:hypothetical protein
MPPGPDGPSRRDRGRLWPAINTTTAPAGDARRWEGVTLPRLESVITEVTVFNEGARVTREVVVVAEGGKLPTEIEIPGLPLSAFDPTVGVRVAGVDGSAEVWASQVRVGLYAREPDEVPDTPADDERKRVRRALASTKRALQRIDQEIEMLSGIRVPDRPQPEEGKPPPASPMAARVALEQFCDEAIGDRIERLRELRQTQRQLTREQQQLADAAQRASSATEVKAGDLAKVVLARLESNGAPITSATLLVDYIVPGARWVPAYQIRLEGDASAAAIQHRALVTQHSGEDWRNVRLSLSTASPLSYSALPELTSIRIGRAQPPPPSKPGFRPPPRGALALFDDYDRGLHQAREHLPRLGGWKPPSTPLTALAPAAPRIQLPSKRPAPPPPPPPGGMVMAAAAPPEAPASRSARTLGITRAVGNDDITGSGAPVTAALEAYSDELMDDYDDSAELGIEADFDDFDGAALDKVAEVDVSGESTAHYAPLPKKRAKGRGGATPADVMLEAMLFTSLRLSGPDAAAQRGRLVPSDQAQTYLEVLTRGKLRVTIDVMSVVQQATRGARASTELPLPPGTNDIRRSKGSFDFIYSTDAVVDVESDYTWHSVPVGTRTAEADVRYVVVPREDTSVFRVATLHNPLDGPLLPGPAEVYVGGEYVLTTQLPTVAPRGELKLGLGVEQAIKCARNTHYREERSGEERVAMTELKHTVTIDLFNHLSRAAVVEVRERIPQPAPDAEVVVDEAGVEPTWEPYTQEERGHPVEGGRRWQVTLAPGAKQTLKGGYVVKLYAVNEIVGGNRREA